jgi:ribonuclease HI
MLNSSPGRQLSLKHSHIFIAEWTDLSLRGIDDLPDHWVMYFDGSYTLKGAGAGVVLISLEGDMLKYAIQIEFPTTNNTAEIRGAGHWTSADHGARHSVTSHLGGDSQLVAKQL